MLALFGSKTSYDHNRSSGSVHVLYEVLLTFWIKPISVYC